MDLVDEEDGCFAPEIAPDFGLLDFRAYLRDVRFDAVERFEAGAGGAGDDAGQGGFPRPGRAVENERGEAVRLNGAPQELALPEDVVLPGNLVQRLWPHA